MLSILSGILGFATSGLPSVLDFFKQKGDQKHELEMARLDMDRALALAEKGFASQERIEEFRTDQVEMQTYAEERMALYKHDEKLS
jgi:multidrug resistance efflux pump